jgi:putative zinc finger/helix-turn-helix YgiT family protein
MNVMTDRCLNCGEVAVEERVVTFAVDHNGKSANIQDRQMFCSACGNISYQGDQISAHEFAVASAVRELEGLLSADELYRIRVKYKLRQTDMEQMLSTGPKTWTRWERGKIPQSKAADKLIRVIAEEPDVAYRLMIQAGVENAEATATFLQIEQDAKRLARALLRVELGERPSVAMEQFADRIADKAFDTARDVRRQAASLTEAA